MAEPSYTPKPFPKIVYHLDGSNKIVHNQEELEKLGPEWFRGPKEASDAFDSLPPDKQIEILNQSQNTLIIEKNYHRRFLAAKGIDQWKVLIEYRDHFPEVAFGSPWSREFLSQLPAVQTLSTATKATQSAPTPEAKSQAEHSSIASILESLRIEARLSKELLAEEVDLDVRTVHRHLSGESRPHLRNLAAYERVFSKLLKRQVVIK